MRKNTFLKSTLRQPVQSFLLLLLMGVISFAFVARATEFAVIMRETERLGGFYRSIAVIEPLHAWFVPARNENGEIVQVRHGTDFAMEGLRRITMNEIVSVIADSGYIDFIDGNRMVSGTIPGEFNMSIGGGMWGGEGRSIRWYIAQQSPSQFGDMLFAGTVLSAGPALRDFYYIRIAIDYVITGYPEWIHVEYGKAQGLVVPLRAGDPRGAFVHDIQVGERWLVRGDFNSVAGLNLFSDRWIQPLNAGWRGQRFVHPDEWVWALRLPDEPGASVDFGELGLGDIERYIRTVRQNQESVGVVLTVDMTAMAAVTQGRLMLAEFRNAELRPGVDMDDVPSRFTSLEQVERYFITTIAPFGRMIDRNDYEARNHVVLVSQVFAATRGYEIGDIIAITLRDIENPHTHGAVFLDYDPNWEDAETFELEVEIVGIFNSLDGDSNNFFVPASIVPAHFGRIDTMSIVLNSAAYEEAFLARYNEAMAEFGMRITFLDSEAGVFWAAVMPIRQNSMLNTLIFGMVLVLSLVLSIFIYIRSKKRDFAILRALGMPKVKVVVNAVLAVCLLGFVSVFGGGTLSFGYALNQAAETLDLVNLPAGAEAATDLSIIWLLGMGMAIILTMLAFATFGSMFVVRKPVLVLLQGNLTKVKKPKTIKITTVADSGTPMDIPITLDLGPPVLPGTSAKKNIRRAEWLYVFRHMRRSSFKSALTVVIAASFVIALGWINAAIGWNTEEIDWLFNNTEVTAEIFMADPDEMVFWQYTPGDSQLVIGDITENVISDEMAQRLRTHPLPSRPYVSHIYLEMRQEQVYFSAVATARQVASAGLVNFAASPRHNYMSHFNIRFFHTDWDFKQGLMPVRMIGVNMVEPFFDDFAVGVEIEFAEGFDEGIFGMVYVQVEWHNRPYPVLIPRHLAEELGVGLGEEIVLIERYLDRNAVRLINVRNMDNALSTYDEGGSYNVSSRLIVAGWYFHYETAGALTLDDPIIIPIAIMNHRHMRVLDNAAGLLNPVFYSRIRAFINPVYNREIITGQAFHQFVQNTARNQNAVAFMRTSYRGVVQDVELRTVITPLEQGLRIMEVLYPITIVLSALVGTGLAMIIMLQNAKNAAIMRVLGAPKQKSRMMLCAEQLLLCFGGIILGFSVLAVIVGDVAAMWNGMSLICAALYLFGATLGAFAASVSITSKMPLELLQVRE
ncbi:MAG: hypothetical protein FWC95_06470 [Defluviitaleaceae bacterium]|nr:hypothetical protein [Defluviitaleaceae bacterium]